MTPTPHSPMNLSYWHQRIAQLEDKQAAQHQELMLERREVCRLIEALEFEQVHHKVTIGERDMARKVAAKAELALKIERQNHANARATLNAF